MSNLIKTNSSAWQLLINDYNTNHLAHAYLFSGPEGIGKKSLAKEYIKYILQANEVISKRIDEDNFLDLLCLKKIDKNEITIDTIRKAHDFFNQTPAECGHKFIVIDAVDNLNLNAANALLKIIEEPTYNTHLFLINHIPGKTLATIRSRCRVISFKPISNDHDLSDLTAGTPGKAAYFDDIEALKLYAQILNILKDNDILSFNKFADSLNKNIAQMQLTMDLLVFLISRCIKHKSNSLEKMLNIECDILPSIASNKTIEEWFKIYDETQNLLQQNEIYNLDKKQILLIIINSISKF